MKQVQTSYQILDELDGKKILDRIDKIARVCYKSEAKIDSDSEDGLPKALIKSNHMAPFEHVVISVMFTVDRALSHELVRHRMASYMQESQRYCNYSKDRFGSEVTFVRPYWMTEETVGYSEWVEACKRAEESYFKLLDIGYMPQQARIVLPNCTATNIVITSNLREWRHIFTLRTHKSAHPDMRELMIRVLRDFQSKIPIVFDDIEVD